MQMGYLASVLNDGGYEVVYSRGEEIKGVGLYIVYASIVTHKEGIAFTNKMRATGVKAGFVGAMATACPELFIDSGDFIIRGEAEGLSADEIVSANGVIQSGLIADINSLSFPHWEIFPFNSFSYSIYTDSTPIFPVLSSRGCPGTCGYYCPYSLTQGKVFRARTPDNVIDELEYLKQKYGARSVVFRDPSFTCDMDRAMRISEKMTRRNIGLRWVAETTPFQIDRGLIEAMAKAGLAGLNIGVESANPEVLESSRRQKADCDNLKELIRWCHELDIKVGAFYIIGHQKDTKDSIEQTMRMSKELRTDYAQFTLATPYPGTRFYDKVRDNIIEKEWDCFDGYTPVISLDNLSPEKLNELKWKALRSFYLRPSYILHRLGLI
jgi:radical SAM superfamily enzyme YgiQ (UPF0313 family)